MFPVVFVATAAKTGFAISPTGIAVRSLMWSTGTCHVNPRNIRKMASTATTRPIVLRRVSPNRGLNTGAPTDKMADFTRGRCPVKDFLAFATCHQKCERPGRGNTTRLKDWYQSDADYQQIAAFWQWSINIEPSQVYPMNTGVERQRFQTHSAVIQGLTPSKRRNAPVHFYLNLSYSSLDKLNSSLFGNSPSVGKGSNPTGPV